MNKTHELFPNTDTVAYYDSFGQFITMSRHDEKESLELLKSGVRDDTTIELVNTLNHELKHWEDHVSTIWGLESLIKIYNAINSKLNNKETDFWRINSLMKDFKRSSFSDYYHVTFNKPSFESLADRWRWEVSMGLKFDPDGHIDNNKPIIFLRFYDKHKNPVSRTPISIHSFLETNSMYKELLLEGRYIESKKDDVVDYNIKSRQFLNKNLSWLYNPDLTVYSVVSHAVSNILGINDIIEAMHIASSLSTFVLNFPTDFYDKVTINKAFNNFGQRNNDLIKEQDRGFVFLNLLYNYAESYDKTKEFDIETLLRDSSLPNSDDVEKIVIENAHKLYSTIIEGPLKNKIEDIYQKGIKLLEKKGVFNQTEVDFEYLQSIDFFPSILWGDSYFDLDTLDESLIMYKIHNQKDLSFWEWLKFEQHMYKQFNIFSNVCGI